jgi:hypothetical protein
VVEVALAAATELVVVSVLVVLAVELMAVEIRFGVLKHLEPTEIQPVMVLFVLSGVLVEVVELPPSLQQM